MNIICVRKNGLATLTLGQADPGLEIDGEFFIADHPCPDWFGFYDWLRTSAGQIIGVRLQLDQPSPIFGNTLKLLCSLDPRNSENELYIFLGEHKDFNPSTSDDTDFGGNVLYRGEYGSVAISFNEATDRSSTDQGCKSATVQ